MERKIKLPMVCNHGVSLEKTEEIYKRAYEVTGCVSIKHFVSTAAYYLNGCYDAEITGIASDMWARVTVETWRDDEPDPVEVSVECDNVEDGIAAIVCWFKDNRTEKIE